MEASIFGEIKRYKYEFIEEAFDALGNNICLRG